MLKRSDEDFRIYDILLLLLLVFISLTYVSTFTTTYAMSDAYHNLYAAQNGHLKGVIIAMLDGGRPLTAAFTAIGFHAAKTIMDLRFLRVFALVTLLAVVGLVYWTIRVRARRPITGLLLAAGFALQPAVQIYIAWSVCALYPLAMLLAGLAFILFQIRNTTIANTVFSTLILLAAEFIYQPAAAFFWSFAAMEWLLVARPNFLRASISLIIFAFVMLLDFISSKIAPSIFYSDPFSIKRALICNTPLKKLFWFFRSPMKDSFNLFDIHPNAHIYVFSLGCVLVSAVFLVLRRQINFLDIAIMVGLIFLSYSSNLVVQSDWSSYRTEVALTSVVIVIVVRFVGDSFGEFRLPPFPTYTHALLPVGLIVFLNFSAAANVLNEIILPQTTEYTMVKNYLYKAHFGSIKRVEIVPARYDQTTAPFIRYDEFGTVSAADLWVPKAMLWLAAQQAPKQERNRLTSILRRAQVVSARQHQRNVVVLDLSSSLP